MASVSLILRQALVQYCQWRCLGTCRDEHAQTSLRKLKRPRDSPRSHLRPAVALTSWSISASSPSVKRTSLMRHGAPILPRTHLRYTFTRSFSEAGTLQVLRRAKDKVASAATMEQNATAVLAHLENAAAPHAQAAPSRREVAAALAHAKALRKEAAELLHSQSLTGTEVR